MNVDASMKQMAELVRRAALAGVVGAAVLVAACDPKTEDQAATTRTTAMGIGVPPQEVEPTAPGPTDVARTPPGAGYPEERRFFGGPVAAGGTTGKESSTSLDGKNGMGAGADAMNDPSAAARALGAHGGAPHAIRPAPHRR